eukprot:SAG22_NODE_1133_length_5415_cov_2.124153_5_plen_249_part_00
MYSSDEPRARRAFKLSHAVSLVHTCKAAAAAAAAGPCFSARWGAHRRARPPFATRKRGGTRTGDGLTRSPTGWCSSVWNSEDVCQTWRRQAGRPHSTPGIKMAANRSLLKAGSPTRLPGSPIPRSASAAPQRVTKKRVGKYWYTGWVDTDGLPDDEDGKRFADAAGTCGRLVYQGGFKGGQLHGAFNPPTPGRGSASLPFEPSCPPYPPHPGGGGSLSGGGGGGRQGELRHFASSNLFRPDCSGAPLR